LQLIDLPTVFTMTGLTYLSMASVMLVFRKSPDINESARLWLLSQLFLGVGAIMVWGRDWSIFWFSSVPNALMTLGLSLQIAAYWSFFGDRNWRRWLPVLTICFMLWQLCLRNFGWNDAHRLAGVGITQCLQQAMLVYVLLRCASMGSALARFLTLANGLILGAYIARLAEAACAGSGYSFESGGVGLLIATLALFFSSQINGFGFLLVLKERADTELLRLATLDPLTEALNRRSFLETAQHEQVANRRSAHPISLLICDIDYFKRVNDTFGHHAGDAVIRAVVGTLRMQSRRDDSLGRWGGEEFVMLLPVTALKEAKALAERMNKAIANAPIDLGGQGVDITMSMGVAQIGAEESISEAIIRADRALYRAKAAGRNRVEIDEVDTNGLVATVDPNWR
jgi:diguanylate cyclase (GGDEF)-like protein